MALEPKKYANTRSSPHLCSQLTIQDLSLFKSQFIAVCFRHIERLSDKALITARFLALAEIHLYILRIKDLHTDFLSSYDIHTLRYITSIEYMFYLFFRLIP